MYFIQVFVDDSSSVSFWLVSLLSPTGVALAMDKVNLEALGVDDLSRRARHEKHRHIIAENISMTLHTHVETTTMRVYDVYYVFQKASRCSVSPQALVLDLQGQGVNFDNLWSGPGIPFGGSLIMMTLDIFLYGWLAYYLDSVIPGVFPRVFAQYRHDTRSQYKSRLNNVCLENVFLEN